METRIRRLPVAVLEPGNYRTGRTQREKLLTKNMGSEALTGDDVGYYMEVEEAELRRRLSSGAHVKIVRRDRNIVIGPVGRAFASDSARLGDGLRGMLDTVAPVLREFSKTLVIIHAYTDASGPAEYNRKLSVRRALAVANYLLGTGIASGRFVAVGHGDSGDEPTPATAKERSENRRVIIELDPLVRQER